MKREIKFRAWDKISNQMGKVVSLELNPLDVRIEVIDEVRRKPYIASRAFAPIMQYTGLLDKNGKEIYEGDIVKSAFVCEVIYDGKYMLKDLGEKGFYFELSHWEKGIKPNEVEIIGNIYENPKLITKE